MRRKPAGRGRAGAPVGERSIRRHRGRTPLAPNLACPLRRAARRERLRSIIGGSAGNVIRVGTTFLRIRSSRSISARRSFREAWTGAIAQRGCRGGAIRVSRAAARKLWVIGALADRHGRRVALSVSVAMMSVGSADHCAYADVCVDRRRRACRADLRASSAGVQHGREAGTSATYLSEMAPTGRRGFSSDSCR